MLVTFGPCRLNGRINAPASKSMAHRYLLGAAVSGKGGTLTGVDLNEDILASIDCLRALGANVRISGDSVIVDPQGFMKDIDPVLECRESGSTLRFFIPLALCLGRSVTLRGSERLLSRPLTVYEDICHQNGFVFDQTKDSITVCGELKSGNYKVLGNISSQFITGLIFALVYLGKDSCIEIIPPLESRPYVDLTVSALRSLGADVKFADEHKIEIKAAEMHELSVKIEGDYSNAAFLDAFNYIGSDVKVENLNVNSQQGDRIYKNYFDKIEQGTPTLDVSDCPDLAPVLIALAAMKNGATLIGTDRLKDKESNRGFAMHKELLKLGGGLILGDNTVIVPKQELQYKGEALCGHNDHRIVMALSVILSRLGGTIEGAEAVNKSYPRFFDDIKGLGAEIKIL